MKKQILNYLRLVLILGIISSFSGGSPKSTVDTYINARASLNHEAAYTILSSSDKSIKSLNEYLEEKSAYDVPRTKAITENFSYKIVSVNEEGDKALAIVELTYPDVDKIVGELVRSLPTKVLDEDLGEKEVLSIIKEKYKDKETYRTIQIDTIELVKEEQGWRIFLDWESEEKN